MILYGQGSRDVSWLPMAGCFGRHATPEPHPPRRRSRSEGRTSAADTNLFQ